MGRPEWDGRRIPVDADGDIVEVLHYPNAGIYTGKLVSPQIVTGINDTNDNEVLLITATASAVNEITVANAATGNGPSLAATGGDTNIDMTVKGKGTGSVILGQATSTGVKLAASQPILDANGNEEIKFVATGSAVNEGTITNAATGNAPSIAATGETNVSLALAAKGTGTINLTSGVAITDAKDIALGSTTGTKIGTAITEKLGFYNVTPVAQLASSAQAAVTPSTSFAGSDTVTAATVLAAVQAVETLANRLRADLVTLGLIKGGA